MNWIFSHSISFSQTVTNWIKLELELCAIISIPPNELSCKCVFSACSNVFIGLLSWNMLDCHVNLEEELSSLTNHGLEGEVARHGNYLFINFCASTHTIVYIDSFYGCGCGTRTTLLRVYKAHKHIFAYIKWLSVFIVDANKMLPKFV